MIGSTATVVVVVAGGVEDEAAGRIVRGGVWSTVNNVKNLLIKL